MRTIIIGLDAFDPTLFEKLNSEGKTPHLGKLVEKGCYSRFNVTNPPQSEVSWTSIATGLNPGGHGIFDFVHRNPETYALQVSLLPTQKNVLGLQFVPPHQAQTIFDESVQDGYQATSLWWPATFPARIGSPVRTIPGLGAPDIFGRLGVGLAYALDFPSDQSELKTRTGHLSTKNADRYNGKLEGPIQKTLTGTKSIQIDFELSFVDERSARMTIGKESVNLELGVWSPIFSLTFKVGFGISIKAVTRAILVRSKPDPLLYFLPLQAHPLGAPWPYATPKSLIKTLWNESGPFLTLGWPQDTTGLEEGFLTDDQFLNLCDQIFAERKRVFFQLIESFNEGVLACVFDTLDRLQHMFWRDRKDIVEIWYQRLDTLVGEVQEKITERLGGEDVHLLIVSDHGFGDFNYKVHLNRWLVEHNYLIHDGSDASGDLKGVKWEKSSAYALGLNSVYLNLEGREGRGIVPPSEGLNLIQTLRDELLQWEGPDGNTVIKSALTQNEAFQGALAEYGPDLIIGYRPGYRASAETGLGQWSENAIELNQDHWNADHCFAAESVPGVLFYNRGLSNTSVLSYKDFPFLALGKSLRASESSKPPTYSDEDQDAVEKRLKDLGYL